MNYCINTHLYPEGTGECERYAAPGAIMCPACLLFSITQIDKQLRALDDQRLEISGRRENLQVQLALGSPDLRPILIDKLSGLDRERAELQHQLDGLPGSPVPETPVNEEPALPRCENCNRNPGSYGDCPFCEACKRIERADEELACARSGLAQLASGYEPT